MASLSHVPHDCPASSHTWLITSNALSIFHFLALGANPWAKLHQTWHRSAAGESPPSCKISARLCKWSRRCALPKFFTFWLWRANPWVKIHQKGRWPASHLGLPSCQISTHAGDNRFKKSADKHIHREAVVFQYDGFSMEVTIL